MPARKTQGIQGREDQAWKLIINAVFIMVLIVVLIMVFIIEVVTIAELTEPVTGSRTKLSIVLKSLPCQSTALQSLSCHLSVL